MRIAQRHGKGQNHEQVVMIVVGCLLHQIDSTPHKSEQKATQSKAKAE